jgi:putative hydrolase of the HAD superfamily
MIQHISFDLWLTLIKSHPLFKRKRAELIADGFHPKNMNVEQIDSLIRQKDKIFDRHNEMFGSKLSAKQMYLHVLRNMDSISHNVTVSDAEWLMDQANELLMEYTPQLVNEQIPDMLNSLQSEMKGLNIGSNTGFIEGKALRRILKKMGLYDFFSFFVFSDEVQSSKPSARFYEHILNGAKETKSDILHVGDHLKNDYHGAENFGFKALLITNSNYTLNDIRTNL